MKKLLKSKKALSPVVAAIILIAVTVAVSIAVAAWMGSLTFTFMETEELRITSATFDLQATGDDTIDLVVVNTGSTDVTFTAATINGADDSISLGASAIDPTSIDSGATTTITLTITDAQGNLNDGSAYTIQLATAKGNTFTYKGTA
jgi:archaeal type IV pilus assembly protein PilA